MTVLIAGGGIGGLCLALTCHQIGVPFKVFEQTREMKPLGVGINLQPNCVRELFDLGLEDALPTTGIKTQEYGMFSKHGLEIWLEPRGIAAGYKWPQYSVHRGEFQMMLYQALIERAGAGCVEMGWRAAGFENTKDGAVLNLVDVDSGKTRQETGSLVIGADGIHSALRAQMAPHEGPPIWGGAILWRATSLAKPIRTGATMMLIGHETQRLVAYPITEVDPQTGLAVLNWIAELKFDPTHGWKKEDWNREANKADFLPKFEDWVYDWLDIPSLINSAEKIYEYPMVDRDPLEAWTDGHVTLLGDAAHPTYPVGSNGATQAIMDGRKLGRAFLDYGIRAAALQAYEAEVRPITTKVGQTNRSGKGPDGVLQMIEDRCGGMFENLDDVASQEELEAHAVSYKKIAGFAIETLNASEQIIPDGAKVRG
ncbi:MAG: flavin-dependent oxidoreductase [Rhizobiaceae bacterium]